MTDPTPAFNGSDPGVAPAARWREWIAEHPFTELDADHPARTPAVKMLVVAAHPDDEVLGAGGLMAQTVRDGGRVTVLCLSDGGASHPGSPTHTPDELAERRRRELVLALDELGVEHVQHRTFPDGGLAGHAEDLVVEIEAAISTFGGHDVVVGVWRGDRHPDHAAVGWAAATASAASGSVYLEYPVWMWHWARPGDVSVPWERSRVLSLPPDVVAAKRRAVEQFTSQIADLSDHPADRAVLPPAVLDRLVTDTELFFT
ncbi:PIG-L deacetylase family protein [Williamsia deligens]|uniref:PIG-L deacetylase family protein n=1 Tax=Williamsia deligens TaxID=321325 RepID=A0ABW3G5W8_9NOCA|nr:PIG-L family deacetylase [Williamsia deligens]MCP2193802.1 N-acetylglucosaminyl deacetylase, LmbE family [Williamsia deligens]